MTGSSKVKIRNLAFLTAVLSMQLLFFGYLSLQRLIARDEGFYLLAARSVLEGKTLYLDFFYPQMPLLPYIFGLWFKIFGISWQSGRIFVALLTALLGTLIFDRCLRKFNLPTAVTALVLFCSCNFVVPWYLTAQTYVLSTLLLFSACAVLDRSNRGNAWAAHLFAGFLFGCAVNTRLFFAGAGPVMIIFLLLRPSTGWERLRSVWLFCLGALLALAPNLLYIFRDFDAYLFNNLGYHLERSSRTLAESISHKWRIMRVLLGITPSVAFDGFQFPILLYLSLLSFFLLMAEKLKIGLHYYIIAVLFILNFLPEPSYVQYFCTLIPFMILAVADLLHQINNKQILPQGFFIRRTSVSLQLILLCVYLLYAPSDFARYTRTGKGVIGIRNELNARDWTLNKINRIAEEINTLTKPDEEVITFWPGYVLSSHARTMPGLENHFGIQAAGRLTQERKLHYRVRDKRDILRAIESHQAPLVVIHKSYKKKRIRDILASGGYRLKSKVGAVSLYR